MAVVDRESVQADGRTSQAVDPARLRQLMAAAGIESAFELAEKAGVSSKTVTRALAGRRISLRCFKKITVALSSYPSDPVAAQLLGVG